MHPVSDADTKDLMQEFRTYDALGLASLIRDGETSAEELLSAVEACVDTLNPRLNCIASFNIHAARARIERGLPEGPFTGVPFLLKDLGGEAIAFPSTSGSRLLRGSIDPADSTIFSRLDASGLVVCGRTTTPENGIGAATEAKVYGGPTRNPWNLDHTPGGSSGGAAAAVAAGIVPAAHGSDGGGSVRIPASCCGLFGFKPTRARIPDGPLAGEGWGGMAIEGFLTRSVRDSAALLDICMGADLGAPYHAPPMPQSYTEATESAPGRLRVALCDTTFEGAPIHPDCRKAVEDVGRLLEDMGHDVIPAFPEAPNHARMMAAWTDIVACGTALTVRAALARLDRPLGPDDLEGVSRGALAYAADLSGADYLAALNVVHAYGRAMAVWFRRFDVLVSPTLAEPPAKIGRFSHDTEDYVAYRTGPGGVFDYSPYTACFNASGQPAMSVPLATSSEGLPIGIHIAGRFGEDDTLMALAADLERAQPWFHRIPDMTC